MQVRQLVRYYDERIYWFSNDNAHRDGDLPAGYYFSDGKLTVVNYYQHGISHRTTGPALISYKDKIKLYFYQGTEYASLGEMQMVEACK